MTEPRKGGRKPAAGTAGYQAAHRRNVWAKARAARAKWEKLRLTCTLRTTADEVNRLMVDRYRQIITQWGAGALPQALEGGAAGVIQRLEGACDTLLWALCGLDEERVPPPAKPTRPTDHPTWSYETSLREAGAVRLDALANISEIEGLLETGEVVTQEMVEPEWIKLAETLRSRVDLTPSRFGFMFGEKSGTELTAAILAELLEVLD